MTTARTTASILADEASLLARLKAGDAAAYEHLVRDTGGRLLAVARRFLRSEEDARDAVQETYVSALKSIARFEGASQVATWLHRILVNVCLMKLRTSKRRDEARIEDLLPKYAPDGHRLEPGDPWSESVDDLASRDEVRNTVRRRIDELPDDFRTVLLLRDIEELDTAETARVLDISEAAVKTRLHRARQALRTLLARDLV